MISKTIETALNEQVNREFYSAYLYLAMSAYCDRIGLPGFAHWMRLQHDEESMHVMRMYDYVLNQGGEVELGQIDKPPKDFGTPLEIFEETLEHEQLVTRAINSLMDLAVQERDYATQTFLQWYVSEQVEEESNVNNIIAPLRMAGDDKSGLMMVDQQLAKRVLPPQPVA